MPRKPGCPSLGWKMGKELMAKARQLLSVSTVKDAGNLGPDQGGDWALPGTGACCLRTVVVGMGGFNQGEHSYGELGLVKAVACREDGQHCWDAEWAPGRGKHQ